MSNTVKQQSWPKKGRSALKQSKNGFIFLFVCVKERLLTEESFKARPLLNRNGANQPEGQCDKARRERKTQRIQRVIVHAGLIGIFGLLPHR
jgi:hypothetical protein